MFSVMCRQSHMGARLAVLQYRPMPMVFRKVGAPIVSLGSGWYISTIRCKRDLRELNHTRSTTSKHKVGFGEGSTGDTIRQD